MVFPKCNDKGCSAHNGDSNYNYCNKHEAYYSKKYPQGWSHYPGDTCKHGVYVGGCGIDWMCGQCEAE